MAVFHPDRYVTRLADVPHEELEEMGFGGLIVDLDNTLMGFRQTALCEDHLAWCERAHDRGFKMVMVSNNFTERVTGIAAQLRITCIPNALKPLPWGVMRAVRMLEMPHERIAVVGDQLFTDVLSGKLCGLYTILTEPIEAKDFPITKLFRFFERLILPERPSSS
jgi:HAD superfamily phosphatase (TIGR01668 family)